MESSKAYRIKLFSLIHKILMNIPLGVNMVKLHRLGYSVMLAYSVLGGCTSMLLVFPLNSGMMHSLIKQSTDSDSSL